MSWERIFELCAFAKALLYAELLPVEAENSKSIEAEEFWDMDLRCFPHANVLERVEASLM